MPILSKEYKYLLDVNIDTHLFITDALQISSDFHKTKEYQLNSKNDFRFLDNAKQEHNYHFKTYIQMFDDKFGFIKNLSVIDLLFMEGPNAISFLEYNKLSLKSI